MVSCPDNDGGRLTPEQRERLLKQLQGIFKARIPKFDIRIPRTAIDSAANSKIIAAMPGLGGLSLPEPFIKNLGMASIFAEQNARLVAQMHPVMEFLSAWHKQMTPITSDIVKSLGVNQSMLNLFSDQLTKGAYFGLSEQLAKTARLYATQQANWLKDLARALSRLKDIYYPANLRGIEGLRLEEVQQVVMLDGIALYAVPRTAIAERLVRAPSSSARRDVLGRKWREIVADCRTIVESCKSAEVQQIVRFATDAIDALETGIASSAQSLTGSIVDTLLRQHLSKIKPLIVPGRNTKNADAYLDFSVHKYIALAPIWQAYQSYHADNGDRVPRTFNRHATAHTVGVRQYSKRNAVQGLMLVCGMLKFIDEQASIPAGA